MPLTEHRGRIASGLELVGERVAIERETRHVVDGTEWARLPAEAVDRADGVGTRAGAVLAGEQSGTGWRAVLAVVVIGQAHPLGGEPIDVRRLVIPTAEAG